MPSKEYYYKDSKKYIAQTTEWVKNNRKKHNSYVVKVYVKDILSGKKKGMDLRLKLLEFIGMKCLRCNYKKNTLALQLDHKKGDGNIDKKRFSSNYSMYRYYLNAPLEAKEVLQTLCANCNTIKRYENKEQNNKYEKNPNIIL